METKGFNSRIGARFIAAMSVIAAALSLNAADARYEYSEADRTLAVTVDDGSTNVFDFAAYGSYLNGNLVTNLIKRGKGGLVGESDIGDYLGDITIEAGTYTYTTNRALGRLAGEDVCGSVYVKDGATLDARPLTAVVGDFNDPAAKEPWGYWNKRIVFGGHGVDGNGALVHTGDRAVNRMVFSSNLVMTADATIGTLSKHQVYMSGGINPMWLDMNGHDLTVKGAGTITWGCLNLKNPGNILSSANFVLQNGNTHLNGGPENCMTVSNNAQLAFNLTQGTPISWTLNATNLGSIAVLNGGVQSNGKDGNATNYSYWSGPVLLGDRSPRIDLKKGFWFSFHGPIYGNGGLSAYSTESYLGQLNLIDPTSTFSGGVALRDAALALWNDGALPSGGGALCMTNSAVLLKNDDVDYTLPELKVHGEGKVSCGGGTWKAVTKTGDGDLTWDSFSGTESLDVQGGNVVFPYTRRAIAGLIESSRTEYPTTWDTKQAWNLVFTNIVTLGADAFYSKYHHLWRDPKQASTNRFMVAYSGFIWNNEATNVNWSFAGAASTHTQLRVDGESVFYFMGTLEPNTTFHGTVADVAPGPHTIDVRCYTTGSSAGFTLGNPIACTNGLTLYWTNDNFAVGFDSFGRDSERQTDYVKLEDPGDGSLFTWTLPEYVMPGETVKYGTSRKALLAPPIAKAKFAVGTGIVSGIDALAFDELEGLPTVSGDSGSLRVGTAWKIGAGDFVGGGKLSASGRLVIEDGVSVTLSDPSRVARSAGNVDYPVAYAAEGIDWPRDAAVQGDTREWRLFLSEDGKTLYARHIPVGTRIVVR